MGDAVFLSSKVISQRYTHKKYTIPGMCPEVCKLHVPSSMLFVVCKVICTHVHIFSKNNHGLEHVKHVTISYSPYVKNSAPDSKVVRSAF